MPTWYLARGSPRPGGFQYGANFTGGGVFDRESAVRHHAWIFLVILEGRVIAQLLEECRDGHFATDHGCQHFDHQFSMSVEPTFEFLWCQRCHIFTLLSQRER